MVAGVWLAGAGMAACSSTPASVSHRTGQKTRTPSSTTRTPSSTTSTTAAANGGSTTTTSAVPPSSTTVTTQATSASCIHSVLKLTEGRPSVSTTTVDTPYLLMNTGAAPCSLAGYPSLLFVVASGSNTPAVVHTGVAPAFSGNGAPVILQPNSVTSAGFVVEYDQQPTDGNQSSCSSISSFDVIFPDPGGSLEVAHSFYPCGSVAVSPIVSASDATSG
jgi:hypothetical protein